MPPPSDRLTTLSDGRPGLRGTLHVEISEPSSASAFGVPASAGSCNSRFGVPASAGLASAPLTACPATAATCPATAATNSNDHQPILDFISSDETLDRYNEVISASGWNLEHYNKNPIFQNAHQYGDIIFTLGKAVSTEVRGGKLV